MIHPFFYELKKGAEHYLSTKGYDLISVDELTESITYSYREQHFIKVVNQGYDSPEVYLGKTDDSTSMIRLDFILELYLNNNMQLIATHKSRGTLHNFSYEAEFLDLYLDQLLNITPFPGAYLLWSKENGDFIAEHAAKLANRNTID